MSSLIEKATMRLEQLRKVGVVVPDENDSAPDDAARIPPVKEVARHEIERATRSRDPQRQTDSVAVLSRRVEINLDALAKAGIVSPNALRSQLADQFRVIKRPLIRNAMGKGASIIANGNLIMVTSALSGEGKSFTAINLALSIATELDNTVMLVDADVARPSVLNVLGLPPGPGLLELLLDESEVMSRMLLKTNIDKLSILPSGAPHERATELLASDAMVRLLNDMAQRYPDRIIIFDSPPLLLTTESRVLATHMGQIVMVVKAESTLQQDVLNALATIETCPVKLLVLNQARTESNNGSGYGYGYGYGANGSR
jgi:protein-tyrosine kinase